VLVRSGGRIPADGRIVDAVFFDKTGTLTKGAHTVTGVAAAQGYGEDDVLRIAGAAEADSEHPLAGRWSLARMTPQPNLGTPAGGSISSNIASASRWAASASSCRPAAR
jgi:magnesium-transporting ATPase (P-type)